MKKASGFTLVELVMVIMILGILAVVAIPRMTGSNEFRAVEFHNRTVAALRFAQKAAVSHRRMVCVDVTDSTVTLTIDHDRSGACNGVALNLPGASTNVLTSSDPANATIEEAPANFIFTSRGTVSTNQTLTIAGQPAITIQGPTGYVN
jgi:MSHA pilin protein MshC